MTHWRRILAGALTASFCLFGLTAAAAAESRNGHGGDRRSLHRYDRNDGRRGGSWADQVRRAHPQDHPKLDRKLNDRADAGGFGISRAIVVLNRGCDATGDYARLGGRRGRHLGIINADVVEVPNRQLRRLADNSCVKDMHWDRPTAGEMNRAAVVEGARSVQSTYGYDGTGVGVAVIDSGITAWHDDLTYQSKGTIKFNGQRVTKFVDFVNGLLTPYDDNGHGTHVAGIIAGNGYDTQGARAGMAPAATLVSLKVLDQQAKGSIGNVIAALDWIVANRATYKIRVVNVSVGAAVSESYNTDPLTLAAKRAVQEGLVVVAAAGNLGKNAATGAIQYGAITAPGNAPWVLTVGAYSHEGTLTRTDDVMAGYSSRGPTAIDYAAKPDIVATGTGIASLAAPGSLLYSTKADYLLSGSVWTANKPYLSLTGTSMSSPVVAGAVALMLQANPKLTPNLVKAILQYTSQNYGYDPLTQGAGFLNAMGAVELARFLQAPQVGQLYPSNPTWARTILWGNHKLTGGVIKPAGSAWGQNIVWGTARDAEGDNIVWGTACSSDLCDNIVWGTTAMDADNIVWGTFDREGDNIVWGTAREGDNIVWGTIRESDNIVWGTECGGADCDSIVWGTALREGDNIVWGTAREGDNIVWGTFSRELDNIVWGTSTVDDEAVVFDDPDVPSAFDGTVFDSLFGGSAPSPDQISTTEDPPPAILTDTTATTTVIGGGF